MINKRIITAFSLLSLCVFLTGSTAYVASDSGTGSLHNPMAPINGRKKEVNFYSMLTNSGREYESWMTDGRKYLKRREYEQAIWAFRKAIKLQPANEEARFMAAWTYEKRGLEGLPGDHTNWDALAIQDYLAAIELADHLPSRFNLAILYRRLGQFDAARKHLEHILMIQSGGTLAKKAEKELDALFAQDVRPNHISTRIHD